MFRSTSSRTAPRLVALMAAITVLTAVALAGCSSDAASPSVATTDGSITDDSTTRIVETSQGPVEVPAHPERVVAISDFPMLTMYDLGLTPVGVYDAGEEYVNPRVLDWWRDIPKVSAGEVGGAVNLEAVAALEPDLIIGIDAQKNAEYDQLSAIAPTVMLSFSTATAPWRDLAIETADLLGAQDQLADLDTEFEVRSAEIADTYADLLTTTRWDVLQGGFEPGSFWVYGPGTPAVDILTGAGVQLADASTAAADQPRRTVSLELVADELGDADGIFYYATNDGEPANLGPALFDSPLFQQLPATTSGTLVGTINLLPTSYQDAIDLLEDAAAGLAAYRG